MAALSSQSALLKNSLVVSSGASNGDLSAARDRGFEIYQIPATTFDHGGTRQQAVVTIATNCDLIIFMTQDAILASPTSLENLIAMFDDASVAAAWGRQLPHDNATTVAAHARHFNYPAQSRCIGADDIKYIGIKAAFCSNSFAAYRVSALEKVGGFPSPVVLGEDMYVAAKLLEAGFRIAYVATAVVYHSHNYLPWQEFSRYFDTGAFHAANPWLLERFGKPSDEGRRFVISELRYLWKNSPWSIPRAILATCCKYLGYKLGTHFRTLPATWPARLGMNKTYWKNWHEKQVGSSRV